MTRLGAVLALAGTVAVTTVPVGATEQVAIHRTYTLHRAQVFLDAYNRHDIGGVLATLDFSDPTFFYDDCDYAFGVALRSLSRRDVAAWLRTRFAEGDYFRHATVLNHNPNDNLVAGIQGVRVSDILRAHGLNALNAGNKMVINANGRFQRAEFVSPDCADTRFPARPNTQQTRVITTAFLDGYNGHLVARVLQMLDKSVVYRDCDYRTGRATVRRGMKQVKNWLTAEFKNGDQLMAKRALLVAGGSIRATIVRTGKHSGASRSVEMRGTVSRSGSSLREVTMLSASCR